jgi:hypothetical protein
MAKTRTTPRLPPLSREVSQIAQLYEGLDKVERKKVLSLLQSIDSASACRDGTKKSNDAETVEEKKMPSQKRKCVQN